jgi:hypothetical protein
MLFVLTAASCSGSYVAPEITPPDRSNPLPASNEFVTVAETEYLTLQYKQDSCEIRVLDENRTEWNSTPTGSVDDPLAKGQYRMALESIIQATFLSGQGNEDTETAMAGSVRRGDFAAYAIPDGLRVELYFPSKLTTVPVEITLDGNSLLCSVKPEQITVKTPENETEQEAALRGYKIISVALMPYFLSAGADAQGYMFVPDGSGALINLNNGKNGNDYSQKVYGNDPALPALEQRGGVMDALLPVFGIYRDGEGVLCVLEDGAALATVNASVAGRRTSYNTVYATFSLRPLGTYSVTNVDGTIRNIAVATDWPVQTGRVSARYYFLGEGGDYSGMAAAYRSHLEKRGFTRQSYDADANAMLDI